MELVRKGVLGMSTGSLQHLVHRQDGELKRWVVGELSLTPTPAEPRTIARKSWKTIGNPSLSEKGGNNNDSTHNTVGVTTTMNKDELKKMLAEIANDEAVGEPVNGGGVYTGGAPSVKKHTKMGFKDDLKSAQLHYLRTGRENEAVKATLQEDSGTGALLVEKDWEREITAKRNEKSILGAFPITRRTVNREYYDVNAEDGQSDFAFVAELGSANVDEPTFAQRSIRLYKASLAMRISNELLEDTTSNLEDFLTESIARAYARNVNNYFLTGTGSGQPQGIVPRVTNIVTLATTTGLSVDNIEAMYHALPSAYHQNGENGWAMRMATLGAIRGLQLNGSFAYQNTPAGGSTANGQEQLKFKTVLPTDGMPAMAASAKSIIFGNWTYARFIEHSGGLKISRNPYVYEATGETAFFVTARWGSDLILPEAMVIGRNAAS